MKRLALLAAFLISCGGGDGSGGGGDGGGGGGGSSCEDVCGALFEQNCFYAGGETDCMTSCDGFETTYVATGPDYCQAAWDDYTSCVTTATLVCTDDFDPDWNAMPCRQHWDHYTNYCVNRNAMPSTPCIDNAGFDTFCTSTPATPKGRVCQGDAPPECVVGGTDNNADLYCCPAT